MGVWNSALSRSIIKWHQFSWNSAFKAGVDFALASLEKENSIGPSTAGCLWLYIIAGIELLEQLSQWDGRWNRNL